MSAKKKPVRVPETPSVETSVAGQEINLPRHNRLIVFGDDPDAEAFDRWWQEVGRIDYIGWTTRQREWASTRRKPSGVPWCEPCGSWHPRTTPHATPLKARGSR